jgi:hypothetical protein
MQKMAAETGSQCSGCGKWLGLTPGYVRALGQQWHPQCFRCGCSTVVSSPVDYMPNVRSVR